jgi:hypothetical protein
MIKVGNDPAGTGDAATCELIAFMVTARNSPSARHSAWSTLSTRFRKRTPSMATSTPRPPMPASGRSPFAPSTANMREQGYCALVFAMRRGMVQQALRAGAADSLSAV